MGNLPLISDGGIGRFFEATRGFGNKMSAKAMAFTNRLAAAGKPVIPYWKPLSLGTGLAIGLAGILSEPPPSLNLSARWTSPNLQSGSGGIDVPNNPHPRSPPAGQPTAPDMTQMMNTARITGPDGHRVQVRGHSMGGSNYGSLKQSLRQSIGGATSVNMQVRDNRRSLSEQHVSDIISGG